MIFINTVVIMEEGERNDNLGLSETEVKYQKTSVPLNKLEGTIANDEDTAFLIFVSGAMSMIAESKQSFDNKIKEAGCQFFGEFPDTSSSEQL